MTRLDSPWYLSARAVRNYANLLGLDPTGDFYQCEAELAAVARVAKFAKISPVGLHEYRGTVPILRRPWLPSRDPRLVLIVSVKTRVEGPLPQLVFVKLRGRNNMPNNTISALVAISSDLSADFWATTIAAIQPGLARDQAMLSAESSGEQYATAIAALDDSSIHSLIVALESVQWATKLEAAYTDSPPSQSTCSTILDAIKVANR